MFDGSSLLVFAHSVHPIRLLPERSLYLVARSRFKAANPSHEMTARCIDCLQQQLQVKYWRALYTTMLSESANTMPASHQQYDKNHFVDYQSMPNARLSISEHQSREGLAHRSQDAPNVSQRSDHKNCKSIWMKVLCVSNASRVGVSKPKTSTWNSEDWTDLFSRLPPGLRCSMPACSRRCSRS